MFNILTVNRPDYYIALWKKSFFVIHTRLIYRLWFFKFFQYYNLIIFLINLFQTTATKARHRGDILEFDIVLPKNLIVYSATFHLYIHGTAWLNGTSSTTDVAGRSYRKGQLFADARSVLHRAAGKPMPLTITINHLLRPQKSMGNDADFEGTLPHGAGRTIAFNVTELVQSWMSIERNSTKGVHQELFLKTSEPWMRALLSLVSDSTYVSWICPVFIYSGRQLL